MILSCHDMNARSRSRSRSRSRLTGDDFARLLAFRDGLRRFLHWSEAEAKAVKCPAIDGILDEADAILSDAKDPEVLDAAALASAQAVEHYEIARYGTLIAWARQLGRNDCASVLEQNLKEEKAADKKLTEIAEARVNRVAV